MQVLWCIAEGFHSPQFKASHVVSKAFFGDAGDTVLWSCWSKISNSFPVRQAGTSAGSSQAICFTSLADALIQE